MSISSAHRRIRRIYRRRWITATCKDEVSVCRRGDPFRFARLSVVSGELEEALRARANTGHGLTRIGTDRSDRHAPTGRGEKLVPDDLGIREASSDEKAADLKGHTRAERDRQLEELSEAVKLIRIDTDKVGAAAPHRTVGSAHVGDPDARGLVRHS